jgi:anti-sigma regulatory factor (Ser/Thr protein kinase)
MRPVAVAPTLDVVRLDVPCDRSAASIVRRALEEVRGLGASPEDALIVASELVTNAVVHSGCSPGDSIVVCAKRTLSSMVIEVQDPGRSDRRPKVRPDGTPEHGGYGLLLVQQIARRWGTERTDRQRVWAELALKP